MQSMQRAPKAAFVLAVREHFIQEIYDALLVSPLRWKGKCETLKVNTIWEIYCSCLKMRVDAFEEGAEPKCQPGFALNKSR